MSNESAVQVEQDVKSKNKGGRPVNPNSKGRQAKAVLEAIPTEMLTREYAVQKLVNEIGCKESSANTFYYTYKASLNKKD